MGGRLRGVSGMQACRGGEVNYPDVRQKEFGKKSDEKSSSEKGVLWKRGLFRKVHF